VKSGSQRTKLFLPNPATTERATLALKGKNAKAKDAVGFGEFLAENLDELYADYRKLAKG
jgi:hypothetical protein